MYPTGGESSSSTVEVLQSLHATEELISIEQVFKKYEDPLAALKSKKGDEHALGYMACKPARESFFGD